tara:strand:- start:83 stop:571 length:489 start_codon:yes stop_codon:yes gene_type:complete
MATLTVTVTESVTLNGAARGSTNSRSITGVDDVYHRIVTLADDLSNATLVSFKQSGVTGADGAMARDNVKYVRITNLDSANPVILNLQVIAAMNDAVGDQNAGILLEAGQSFMMSKISDAIELTAGANDIDDVANLHDLESIMVDPLSEAVKVEIFVASVVA